MRLRFTVVLLFVLGGAGCATVGHSTTGISNFDCVSPTVYRGAQPTPAGICTLADMHIKTVINLRDDADGNEEKLVSAAGMAYFSLPQNPMTITPADADRFLAILASAQTPVFVHCQLGRDRTGLAIAAYRLRMQHWSSEQAVADLYAHGHNWLLFPKVRTVLDVLAKTSSEPLLMVAAAK